MAFTLYFFEAQADVETENIQCAGLGTFTHHPYHRLGVMLHSTPGNRGASVHMDYWSAHKRREKVEIMSANTVTTTLTGRGI